MVNPTSPRLSRLALVLGALCLSLPACIPAPADESFDEPDTNHEGLSGPLSVGTTLKATTDVNLRSGPSTSNSVLDVIPTGSTVTLQTAAPSNGFYRIAYAGVVGWTSGKYLAAAGASTSIAGGNAWKFRAATLPIDLAVFVPEAADAATDVDVLVYAHGLNVCSPVAGNPPLSFVTDEPFHLAKIVDATKRPLVLVVPWLDWEHLSANGMAFGGSHHKLGIPANLNGVVAEVLAQVGQHRAAGAPGLSSLILAGHSRAYDFLNPLAAVSADPQMATGALAQLTRVWGLDTGYVCTTSQWSTWLKSKPELDVAMDYRAGTQTASCGQQFAALVPLSGGRLTVHVAAEEHCAVPGTELPGLLGELP